MQFLIKIVFSVALVATLANAKGIDIKEGKWSWSMTMEMPGMQMPPVEYDSCVTKNDLNPQQQYRSEDCKVIKNSFSGNTYEWEMRCKNDSDGISVSKGKIHYTKTSAKGEMSVSNQGMKVTSKISGKYAGPCKR